MKIKIPETITEEEFLTIIKNTKKKHHKLAFMLGFYEAMRVSEVVKLKQEDIDKGRRIIKIKDAKGGKDRNIPIMPEIMRYINLLPIGCGIRALQISFHGYSMKILNKDLHFHTLRHSGATHYLNIKKWNIRQVQVLLGHSRLDTTQIYTHVAPDDLIKLAWGE